MLESVTAQAVPLGMLEMVGRWQLANTLTEELAAVTPAQVQHVARTYFQPTSRVTGRFFPDNNTGAT